MTTKGWWKSGLVCSMIRMFWNLHISLLTGQKDLGRKQNRPIPSVLVLSYFIVKRSPPSSLSSHWKKKKPNQLWTPKHLPIMSCIPHSKEPNSRRPWNLLRKTHFSRPEHLGSCRSQNILGFVWCLPLAQLLNHLQEVVIKAAAWNMLTGGGGESK